jgi:hypothetical protein
MAKKATDQTITGESGVHLIAQAVDAMGHLWHPTVGADSGIDGQIELRDPVTREVTNFRIGVQSKATRGKWPGETDTGFHFAAKPDDVRYWFSSNQPVLLICSRPDAPDCYWRSVQEWGADPAVRHRRRVDFDKERDRFDVSARDALFDLKASAEDRLEPPSAPRVPEQLLTNLMPLVWQADRLFSAHAPALNPRLLVDPAPAYHDGRLWSLREFSPALLREAHADDLKSGPLDGWRDSAHASDTNLVRELVRRELLARHRDRLRWNERRGLAYFRRQVADWQQVSYNWAGGTGRTVVAPQHAKQREGYTGYRHDAVQLDVRRLDGQWYLQLKPSYLFTWDGVKVSRHHHSALKGIKRLDGAPAVSQMLRMFEHLFVERLTLDGSDSAAPFSLAPLVVATAPVSIPDAAWRRTDLGIGSEDPDDANTDSDAATYQGSFDLDAHAA